MPALGVRPCYEGVLMYSTGRKSFLISFPETLSTYLRIPPPGYQRGKELKCPFAHKKSC